MNLEELPMRQRVQLSQADIEQVIADRRALHSHPELAYNETITARKVAERLDSYGCEVKTGVGRTGVVGLLSGTKRAPGAVSASEPSERDGEIVAARTLLYRADMDA